MTRNEWEASDDGLAMLRWFLRNWLGNRSERDRLAQRYCLACSRRIWKLLPDEHSRRSVEVGERHNKGLAKRREWELAIYDAQGAYYNLQCITGRNLDEHQEAETVRPWISAVAAIPADEMGRMARPRPSGLGYTPEELLESAAGFVEFALICYDGWGKPPLNPDAPGIVNWMAEYSAFLHAPLLRDIVGHTLRVPTRRPDAKCHFRATRPR